MGAPHPDDRARRWRQALRNRSRSVDLVVTNDFVGRWNVHRGSEECGTVRGFEQRPESVVAQRRRTNQGARCRGVSLESLEE